MSEIPGPGDLVKIVDSSVADVPPALDWHYAQSNRILRGIHLRQSAIIGSEQLPRSHITIAAAAQTALDRTPAGQESSALFIGSGSCLDLPVKRTIEEFDRVTFVDFNTEQTEKALRVLPPRLLEKVTVLQTDVTAS